MHNVDIPILSTSKMPPRIADVIPSASTTRDMRKRNEKLKENGTNSDDSDTIYCDSDVDHLSPLKNQD